MYFYIFSMLHKPFLVLDKYMLIYINQVFLNSLYI